MEIEIVQSVRDDGAILQSIKIPVDLKLNDLASQERKELAEIFMQAALNLLRNTATK